MNQLPPQQELLSKIIQLQSYVQTLERSNQSKNSELALLRKKVQLLKDQNMVLKVQSKNTSSDKYISMQNMILELQDKFQGAMQQCVYYRAENEKLKRRLELQNKNFHDEGRISIKRGSHPTGIPSSPTKISYPLSILKNSDRVKDQNILSSSIKFNTVDKRASNKYSREKYSTNVQSSSLNRDSEGSLEYSKEQNSFDIQNNNTPIPAWIHTMTDGNISFNNNAHNDSRKNKSVTSNSSSQREKLITDSHRDFKTFSDRQCQAMGKIIEQLRDGKRKIKRQY